ncbi:MAG: imidazole glycerol phosphate synthase subunit HisF [Caldicoprobacter oshimai]|uniref:Imidazole glycerol phosphate synthase subunit HisF n=1 Tax=Caldicoprobacter faecalis TaxID=937334 RepID=A0A1I5RVN6_9FIRM|nr:imidazole glycerol phosphate synthase subunit HisF [Caldicoprobacter faecalis]PZN12181.1 MAG: imidazole glycerol phosphate synthase subunit HisF [Caldicoprobacter oshimai]SFP62513.1 cyclase [Caldicoprobacter faecalis]
METIRIIPCLDVYGGRVVKGVHFANLRDAGDPVEIAKAYEDEGADELVFLDISATVEGRKNMLNVVEKVVSRISIPLTVGGGIAELSDIRDVLESGASKVSVGTAAYKNPDLIAEAAGIFGPQRIIVAIDAKMRGGNGWDVYIRGGKENTGKDAIGWAVEVEKLGAGEILLTSMDRDGTKDGYDIPLTKAVSQAVSIPVIASGGAGTLEHFYQAVVQGGAKGVLAASVFHFKEVSIQEVKDYLAKRGVPVKGNMNKNAAE